MTIKNHTKQLSVVTVGFIAALSMTAVAGGVGETTITTTANGLRTATVSFADLDLSTAAAQETLYYRLSGAARKVCGSADIRRVGSVRIAADNKACYDSTLEQAMSDTHMSQVAAIGQ